MIHKKSNYQIANSALSEVREDHYDGVNAIYRLAATVPIPDGTPTDGIYRLLNRLSSQLSTLEVRANRIFIGNHSLDIDFYPKGYQMVMTRGQYAGLQLELAEFLSKSGIKGITIQSGSFMDDPDNSVKTVSNNLINFFPEFNSKCFGAYDGESIEVINLNMQMIYEEVA